MLESRHFVSDVTHAEVSAARRDWVEIASSGAGLSACCPRRDDPITIVLNVPEKEFQAARQLTMCGYRPGETNVSLSLYQRRHGPRTQNYRLVLIAQVPLAC